MLKSKQLKIIPIEYSLQTFHRSNQDTSLLHRPVVFEGDWVQTGDLLADCSSSKGGEFSIGRNILIAYLPWEGYNYEDAILINERLVYDELYTSIHIERYEVSIETTMYGDEKITKDIPQLKDTKELDHLDNNGIALLGTWLKDGNILVGKITPTEPKKTIAPYIQLYNDIMGKKMDYSVRDTSLRMPRGLEAKLVKIKIFKQKSGKKFNHPSTLNFFPIINSVSSCIKQTKNSVKLDNKFLISGIEIKKFSKLEKDNFGLKLQNLNFKFKTNKVQKVNSLPKKKLVFNSVLNKTENLSKLKTSSFNVKFKNRKQSVFSDFLFNKEVISTVHVYLAEKRKIQVGDKMAGRHGNKGIISEILSRQDMPYLPDGTPIDMALNPLGVPSRMNVGQIYECLLGLAGKKLREQYRILPFDELYGPEASRSFVFSKLYEAKKKTGQSWLFQPSNPGKLKLFDGRDGNCFDQPITAGYSYMIKLVHLVDDKIHCLTADHEVLTTNGWIPINQIKLFHKVASLEKNGLLIYQNPLRIYHYPKFKGKLYKLKTSNIDLLTTLNHQMLVTTYNLTNCFFENYDLMPVKKIIGKSKNYLKIARWKKKDYQFFLPSLFLNSKLEKKKKFKMNTWLQFFGIWLSQGWVAHFTKNKKLKFNNYFNIKIYQKSKWLTKILIKIIKNLGYTYKLANNIISLKNKQLGLYLQKFNGTLSQKTLPKWVWKLSRKQSQILLQAIFMSDLGFFDIYMNYYTLSSKLSNDIMRLALHAGWSGHRNIHYLYNLNPISKNKTVFVKNKIWCINLIQTNNHPSVNLINSNLQKKIDEQIIYYEGAVFCLSLPNKVFYVRRNGIPIWTGNSRSTGPYSLVTQQPLKGRSKHGGQRLGEMEVWALEAYGAAFTLLELLTIKSDDVTGRLTIWDYVLYKRPLYIGTPASFKVLICELESLCLDIGIFKNDNLGILRAINVSNMG